VILVETLCPFWTILRSSPANNTPLEETIELLSMDVIGTDDSGSTVIKLEFSMYETLCKVDSAFVVDGGNVRLNREAMELVVSCESPITGPDFGLDTGFVTYAWPDPILFPVPEAYVIDGIPEMAVSPLGVFRL